MVRTCSNSAFSYASASLQASQTDDEIARHTFLPGSFATITVEDGVSNPLRGEIRLSISRTASDRMGSYDRPYWLLCFSTELDSRLIPEFATGDMLDQGYLVVNSTSRFCRRISEAADAAGFTCGSVRVDYFDEYFPPDWSDAQVGVIGLKPFRFAYQRELRIFLLPDIPGKHPSDQPICLQAKSMGDILGVYSSTGEKVAGAGAKRLFRLD